MTIAPQRNWIFLLAAALCFVVALLLQVGAVNGSDAVAWTIGGLLSFTLAHF